MLNLSNHLAITKSSSVEHIQDEQHTADLSKVITMDSKVRFEVANSNIWLNHLATTTIIQAGQWYPYLGVNCILDRLLLVVMICATWLWFHQSNCIVLKCAISWEKYKTLSVVDMGYICIILIYQWNKLMGTRYIEDTTFWMLFSHLCRQIGDRISHLDTRFAILWWPMSRILNHWCCKRKYTSSRESSGLQGWFGFWKRDEKGELHRQTWVNLFFTWKRCGRRIHVSWRVAFSKWLDEICIALWFKLFPCFETLCFSR